MADQSSKDAASKDRIIRHMNADHQASLSYYLQHYSKLSSRASSTPHLRDISFNSMTLESSGGKHHTVPINPPLTSWAEARTRLVDMDREARLALDISDVRITKYEPPTSLPHIIVFGLCLFTFAVFIMRTRITEGTWFYDTILPYFPGGPAMFLAIAGKVWLPVLAIHMGEAYWLDRSRLRKHGVKRGTALWWQWISSCFIEGGFCFQRIDAAVKRKALETENGKH